MPNQHSKASHVPIRTCIICKNKNDQKQLLGFYVMKSELVFDIKKRVATRHKYVCYQAECINMLDKWLHNQLKKSGRTRSKRAAK